jgi:SpoVK/Ycf46/Vps4 family AAA+-type ATPase
MPSAVEVGVKDFREAITSLKPSISEEDLAYFQKIRDKL